MKYDDGLSAALIKIMSNVGKSEVSHFMDFFLEERQKYLNAFFFFFCKTSMCHHPMIIRYCLALQAKSATVYNEIRYDWYIYLKLYVIV